jgi:hypothetical protein
MRFQLRLTICTASVSDMETQYLMNTGVTQRQA